MVRKNFRVFTQPGPPAAIITTSTLVLKDAGNNTAAGSVGYSGTTATFTPSSNLAYSTVYTLTVVSGTSGVKDLAGNGLASDHAWSFTTRPFGTATDDYGDSVATDAGGNVYVAGFTSGALDGQTVAGSYDLFVVKYDSAGNKKQERGSLTRPAAQPA